MLSSLCYCNVQNASAGSAMKVFEREGKGGMLSGSSTGAIAAGGFYVAATGQFWGGNGKHD
jgi:hypothetical protein|eukprot:evm.model.NODE_48353_length_4396_cov_20.753412.1